MNLFMHYAFDAWMQRSNPLCPFARYADDAVVHCRSREQAEELMRSIALRLAECGLTIHPEKSKVVYCKGGRRTASCPHVHFTFLGFTFRTRKARGAQNRMFTSFLPGVSADALKRMRQVVRGWRIYRQTPATLAELAKQCNPAIRGWWNYYGAFYRTAMHKLSRYLDQKLEQWARRKYKMLLRHERRSLEEAKLLTLALAIHEIDANIATSDATTMTEVLNDSTAAYLHRSSAWLVGGFAALALVLSVVGLYGVIAYSVSQRTREIGVRMALGAQRGSVYRLILTEAGWLMGIGIVAGLFCSVAAATLMRKLLFGTQAWDATTLAEVAVVLALSAMLASYLPARRAASVNPVEALRAE